MRPESLSVSKDTRTRPGYISDPEIREPLHTLCSFDNHNILLFLLHIAVSLICVLCSVHVITMCTRCTKDNGLLSKLPTNQWKSDHVIGVCISLITILNVLLYPICFAFLCLNNRPLSHTPCWKTKQYNWSPVGNEIYSLKVMTSNIGCLVH